MGLLRNAKILLAINPTMDQLGKEFSVMSLSVHSITQILLTAANGVSVIIPNIPLKYHVTAVGVISLIQSIVALLNHTSPPAGTSANSNF